MISQPRPFPAQDASTGGSRRAPAAGLVLVLASFALGCGGGGGEGPPPQPEAAPAPLPTNCRLAALLTSLPAPLSPPFDPEIRAYVLGPVLDAQVSVTATPEDGSATVQVGGLPAPAGGGSSAIDLQVGWNSVAVTVTAGDGVSACITTLLVQRTACAQPTGLPFAEEFSDPLAWTASGASVALTPEGLLRIAPDMSLNDFADRAVCFDLTQVPLVIEARLKLVSGGSNYRLPYLAIEFEDGNTVQATYLTAPFGWAFDGWTDFHGSAVPGENHWAVLRLTLTSGGGTLSVKPDDLDRGWHSEDYAQVAQATWAHERVTRLRCEQPWDSDCLVDWVRIHRAP